MCGGRPHRKVIMSNGKDKDGKDNGHGNGGSSGPGGGSGGKDPETGPTVHITVNNAQHEIHRGRQSVAAIKTAGGVPLADDLEQVQDGKLTLLPDDGAVTIKGGERFISHPKTGGSANH